MDEETSFQEMYKLVEKNGWIRISPQKYNQEKKLKKYQTARIGLKGFFILKKSDKEIEKFNLLKEQLRKHWGWLKLQDYEELIKFINCYV